MKEHEIAAKLCKERKGCIRRMLQDLQQYNPDDVAELRYHLETMWKRGLSMVPDNVRFGILTPFPDES